MNPASAGTESFRFDRATVAPSSVLQIKMDDHFNRLSNLYPPLTPKPLSAREPGPESRPPTESKPSTEPKLAPAPEPSSTSVRSEPVDAEGLTGDEEDEDPDVRLIERHILINLRGGSCTNAGLDSEGRLMLCQKYQNVSRLIGLLSSWLIQSQGICPHPTHHPRHSDLKNSLDPIDYHIKRTCKGLLIGQGCSHSFG